MCKKQHKVIGLDTISGRSENHSNRCRGSEELTSLQPQDAKRLPFSTTTSKPHAGQTSGTTAELGASRPHTLCSHIISTFFTPSTIQKGVHSLNLCQHIFIHTTLYLDQFVTDTLILFLFLKHAKLDLASGPFCSHPFLAVSSCHVYNG